MAFYNIADWRVQYAEPLSLLRLAWVGGHDLARLRKTLVELQQLAKELQITRVQLELDTLPDLPVFDQIWLGTHWMPTVLQLPLKQVVLVLGSTHIYNVHAIETILWAFRNFIRFDVQFFTQPEPGMQWLVADPSELASSLAEWQQTGYAPDPDSDSFAELPPGYGPIAP